MSESPPTEASPKLDALTGIRILAALWVVIFHIRGNLGTEFERYKYIAPVADYGELGVELFFVLSGFVIALAYGRRLGYHWSWAASFQFWWARFVRLWPAYMTMLVIVTGWHSWLALTNQKDPVAPRDLSFWSFLRQVAMVSQWTESDSDRLTWNGPAWTVSAEVLAYLIFPLLTLALLKRVDRLPTILLIGIATLTTFPLIASTIIRGSLYEPWTWALRIGCCFVSGYFSYYFYERIRSTRKAQALGGFSFVAALIAFLAILMIAHATGHHAWGFAGISLMPIMIVSLALDRGPISRVLSSRVFVAGGMISYSVYLVHMPLIEPLWYLQGQFAWLAPGTLASRVSFLAIPALVLLGGYVLWRFVEEPARRALRVVPTAASARLVGLREHIGRSGGR